MGNNEGLLNGLETFAWSVKDLPLRFLGDEALKTICTPVAPDEFSSPEIMRIADEMVGTLTKYREKTGVGRGLAANQIGYTRRMAVLWLDDGPLVLCNPHVNSSEGTGSYWESCLSTGTLIIGEVLRPWTAEFGYQDIGGEAHTISADEKQTRVLLHEIDHLDGHSCTEKYEPGTMKIVTGGKEEILNYKFQKVPEA